MYWLTDPPVLHGSSGPWRARTLGRHLPYDCAIPVPGFTILGMGGAWWRRIPVRRANVCSHEVFRGLRQTRLRLPAVGHKTPSTSSFGDPTLARCTADRGNSCPIRT